MIKENHHKGFVKHSFVDGRRTKFAKEMTEFVRASQPIDNIEADTFAGTGMVTVINKLCGSFSTVRTGQAIALKFLPAVFVGFIDSNLN
eukprot:CAMPEP_0202465312 /NCGR_PEP_ID=MMETSP1360-20130828/65145_1 /ASSEMBLY_ACC=CAM_ASM_000848 /TAXON_ID=515479 /ORGANISM="Licmophora paradoxa, Strain CCMP2313" /LENGTH=88 /DNA_ID=CAMNT_0049088995 /DNA_START=12 /DNA_END=275 /DNA_ORIENTATION=+